MGAATIQGSLQVLHRPQSSQPPLVSDHLLGLIEVVLDAQVILQGVLVLEEPVAELTGHAAHGPVLIPD